MMFDLPDTQTLYAALSARDPSYEGVAWVGVTSTGIFCRFTCPARKPLPENCSFHGSVTECLEAGFRPCKRCHPMQPRASADPVVAKLVEALERDPARRWGEGDVIAMGLDPSTVRRAFRRQYGVTFLELARQMRLRAGFDTLRSGGPVIDAQLDAGFDSPAAFRTAFAGLMGLAPGKFDQSDPLLWADWIDTPLGPMIAVADTRSLHLLEFVERKGLATELKKLWDHAKGRIGLGRTAPMDQTAEQLEAYFAGHRASFDVPITMHGTPFFRQVWAELQRIPAGQTISYGELATRIGKPTASRAVARANGSNQIALIIPCHRVIGADGSLTGYAGGLWRKEKLIAAEKAYATS